MISGLLKVLVIILMFGIIVFVHEFGHFLFAKLNKIKVNEFAIGMGPAIAKWKKKETQYSLRCLPIGGYCLMEGEAEDSKDENAFNTKSIPARLAVCFAGPFFNFILAFLLSIIICHFYMVDPPVLTEVLPGSAAEEAGLQEGDTIVKLNGSRIYTFREISVFRMVTDPAKPIKVTYERDGQRYDTTVTLKFDEESQSYMFGITSLGRSAKNFLEELKYSLIEVRYQVKTTFMSLKMLFTGKASANDLMGPVGIGHVMSDVIDEAAEQSTPETRALNVFLNIINFMVLISANLGVMNLLPIPALDGGRILFILAEAVVGKPIPRDKEAIVNGIGFVLLMLLMVFVFFNDITNLFAGAK